MADEPEDLVLQLLRTLRGEIALKFDQLDAKVDRIDQKVDSVIRQLIDMKRDISMLHHAIAPGEM